MKEFSLSDIEDIWIGEKSNEELTELSDDFYKNAASYVAELARELEGSENLRRDLLQGELKHVLKMIQEIYLTRILKMTDALVGERGGNFLTQERQVFDEIREKLENLREELVTPAVRGESELKPPVEASNIAFLVLSNIPEPITAADMRSYGPFEMGDIAHLPKKTVELLVDQGLAKELQVREAY